MTTGADRRERFLGLVRDAARDGALVKLTLGKYRGSDASLRQLLVRPVVLQAGPRWSFVWRHATRDVTKNHPIPAALAEIEPLVGGDFLDAHLFTTGGGAQLECQPDGSARLHLRKGAAAEAPAAHDREKSHPIDADAPWLRGLGVTNDLGRPREGMAAKYRPIQKFSELLAGLIAELGPAGGRRALRSRSSTWAAARAI